MWAPLSTNFLEPTIWLCIAESKTAHPHQNDCGFVIPDLNRGVRKQSNLDYSDIRDHLEGLCFILLSSPPELAFLDSRFENDPDAFDWNDSTIFEPQPRWSQKFTAINRSGFEKNHGNPNQAGSLLGRLKEYVKCMIHLMVDRPLYCYQISCLNR